MTKEEFTQLFLSKGGKQSELYDVAKQVEQLIIKKTLFIYIEKLKPAERDKIHAMDVQTASEYFTANKDHLPKLTQEEINSIASNTWQSYVDSVLS